MKASGGGDHNCCGRTYTPPNIREDSALLHTCIPESLENWDKNASHSGVGCIGSYLLWLRLTPASPLASSPTASIFLPSIHSSSPPPSLSWVNPGWPQVLKALQWQSLLYWTVKTLAGKTVHKSVKYTVKIASDLWDSVLSKMILTTFECCAEMWQLHMHLGCLSSLPLAACEQCCHDTPWALFRSAIFWRSPWPSPR